MNTSGINNINQINSNNIELNIKNMNEEFNNIINNNNNNTGSSSGRRKREKKKLIKKKENNIMEFDLKEGQKGIQNEIKEQIKQFVIEEHNNNNNNDALEENEEKENNQPEKIQIEFMKPSGSFIYQTLLEFHRIYTIIYFIIEELLFIYKCHFFDFPEHAAGIDIFCLFLCFLFLFS